MSVQFQSNNLTMVLDRGSFFQIKAQPQQQLVCLDRHCSALWDFLHILHCNMSILLCDLRHIF